MIHAGQSYIDVPVVPFWNEIADTGSRTVNIIIEESSEYTPGSSATISIHDDVDTMDSLIHEEAFQLSGSSGYVNGSMEVTFTPRPGPEDLELYTWEYQLQNPSAPTGTTTWTTFTVPLESTDDVDNVQGPSGWTATVGLVYIEWVTTSGGLAPGQSATFSFTTEPRLVDGATVEVSDGTDVADSPNADAPAAQVPTPRATISFGSGPGDTQQLTIAVQITTASGATLTSQPLAINVFGAKDARDELRDWLNQSGFQMAEFGDNSFRILGKRVTDQGNPPTIDRIKSITVTITNKNENTPQPLVNGSPGVTVNP